MKADLLVLNASEVLTVPGPGPRRGAAQSNLGIVRGGAVAIADGKVLAVGTPADLGRLAGARTRIIDARGGVVMPGFVDAHTHAAFAGSRAAEFEARTRGATYLEIMAAGGGIMSTVRATREASVGDVVAQSLPRLGALLAHGTTTAEVKTGYGLATRAELAMLLAIGELRRLQPVSLVATFLGAHAIPAEFRGRDDDYVDLVVDEMLPAAASGKAGAEAPAFCDVFCETGAFSLNQSRRILQAAAGLGLGLKIHADEFDSLGGAALAADLGAVSADHLACTPRDEVARLAAAGVIAVLLPGTTVGLGGRHFANGRAMIDEGVAVALGSDLNPGTCWCESMPLIMALACRYNGLTPAEAVVAATLNAAWAVGLGHAAGSLTPGHPADALVLTVADHRDLVYRFGANPVAMVIKVGQVVVDHTQRVASP